MLLCEHLRSVLRAVIKGSSIESIHKHGTDIIRDAVLGVKIAEGSRKGKFFTENGMLVYDVEVLNALGAVYAEMGFFDKAEIYFNKALDIFPTHNLTLKNLGQLNLDVQHYDKALPIFKKILKKDPKNLKANFGLGLCYEKIGNLDKANDLFQKVITLSPKDPLATEAREKLSHIAMHWLFLTLMINIKIKS